MIKKNLKEWEECLPHVEFAYNRSVHRTTGLCPFEVVYGFKPITPLDLLPLPVQERTNLDASKRADYVKKLHEKTKIQIEEKNKIFAKKANKNKKKVTFKPGDQVWVHLRKERFPEKRKSKLMPRGDGPFKVLAKINDNAYKIDLPEEYGVSPTFNVSDLSPYLGDEEESESRTTLFEEGEDDEDISPHKDDHSSEASYKGPMTRSKAKELQNKVNSFLTNTSFNESFMLPNSSVFLVLRNMQMKQGIIEPSVTNMDKSKELKYGVQFIKENVTHMAKEPSIKGLDYGALMAKENVTYEDSKEEEKRDKRHSIRTESEAINGARISAPG